MAKTAKQSFEDVVSLSNDGSGRVVIDLSAFPVNAKFTIEGLNGRSVRFGEPARKQTATPDVINASIDKYVYNIGHVLPDGWVVGPSSPKTGIVMAIEPFSSALRGYTTWYLGEQRAYELRKRGHANARQPSADDNHDEWRAIYENIASVGRNGNTRLDTSRSAPYGRYWSSTIHPDCKHSARIRYLGDGNRGSLLMANANARVRCVRDEPGITLR